MPAIPIPSAPPTWLFVNHSTLRQIADDSGYIPVAPDLAGEVISPNDTFSAVEEKALGWLAAGTRIVLLVDPGTRTLHVYRAADNIVVFDEQGELDASDVVAGLRFSVGELFL